MSFHDFSSQIHKRFQLLAEQPLYVLDVDPNTLWQHYLSSFPEGTNPLYRTNTEHDCHCCRDFIKHIGAVCTISLTGDIPHIKTIWEVTVPYPYDIVSKRMSEFLQTFPIKEVFLTSLSSFGKDHNIKLFPDGQTVRFDHFHADIPINQTSPAPAYHQDIYNKTVRGIERAITEITPSAISAVIELCQSNGLYRGTEDVLKVLQVFQSIQNTHQGLLPLHKSHFLWTFHNKPSFALRNTAVGNLLQDLSNGRAIEASVRSYETIVAPANYRRTTAPVTKGMVDNALTTIKDLSLEPSLHRRYASEADIPIAYTLWTNRVSSNSPQTALQDLLNPHIVSKDTATPKSQSISIDTFITDILPGAKNLEILFTPAKLKNLVSLTTACTLSSPLLFSWKNPFAWSYRGNVTDSIKERVKRAGGNIHGVARISLSWHNTDDLDLHYKHAESREHIYYSNRNSSFCYLDVDMNAHSPLVNDAVENITWPDTLPDGKHIIEVKNYYKRQPTEGGFEVEVEIGTFTETFYIPKNPNAGCTMTIAHFTSKDGNVISFEPGSGISATPKQTTEWNLKVNQFHPIHLITLSPNYWEQKSGNKHWFFFIKDCINPEATQGFYNEYLHNSLHPHRKVFELLSSKMTCEPSINQLSGLGFSSTIPTEFIIKVDNRPYTITI